MPLMFKISVAWSARSQTSQYRNCWVLEHSTAKRLLKQMPPKHVKEQLRFRSVDSCLSGPVLTKFLPPCSLLSRSKWQERFVASYKKPGPSDFETRKISIIELSGKRWGDSVEKIYRGQPPQHSVRVNELGVIAVLPLTQDKMPGLAITLLPLIIYHPHSDLGSCPSRGRAYASDRGRHQTSPAR